MIRTLKVLGLAIAAVLAVSGIGGSAASAALFHLEANGGSLNGSQTTQYVIATDPGKVTCKSSTVAGEASSTTFTTLGITTVHKECTLATIFGNIAVEINNNGCWDELTSHINAETRHISCPSGRVVAIGGPGCTITFPPQTLGGITYDNKGGGGSRDVEMTVNSSGGKYSYSGFTCGSGTNTTNATFTGGFTLGASSGLWWE